MDFGQRECGVCKLTYIARRKAQRFCSKMCRFKWHGERLARAKELLKKMEAI